MVKARKNNLIVVELTEKLWIYTEITLENHAALRSGFAGYPANPRWNVTKYLAWKQGYQWREELSQGKLVVSQSNSQLIGATEIKVTSTAKFTFPQWRKKATVTQEILLSS
ncbi:hypothetical protein [Gloeocapsa sp. PCC 73106]|uniref:hypothetical protein n=1 Tax=Gloeocapsa sp. PCC 73106 TaxID=102232 RepID=UPI0002ABD3AE|nr:hypothetical protein [Gloeocapsa sp. PCC 73106]ELR96249.1 hypothetical protein GLO73106DRAFT_00000370 [Gloeocapsa sp. PCC 73106]